MRVGEWISLVRWDISHIPPLPTFFRQTAHQRYFANIFFLDPMQTWNQFNISSAGRKIENGEESNLAEMRSRRGEEREEEKEVRRDGRRWGRRIWKG